MNIRNLRIIEVFALAISIVATVVSMLYSAGGKEINSEGFGLILWAICPYFGLFIVELLIIRVATISKKPIASISKMSLFFCIISLLVLVLTLGAYAGTIGNKSSTSSLMFLFLPFYLIIGEVIIFVGGLIWSLVKSPENTISKSY